ncbi:DUF6894 family protein [Methylobacterium nonmethylotrophicum]|uniref:DUF6894 domain-containing protein n=1 Tax=Methylobacterium nonmethylotrophicum TaxID=1141884 RepID=A0A4Z0NFA9_9HYPH|nr:hypothetical protein [Methylobacterium nonmethylotrophicum]TGD94076.1 hypothetical protein EU555_32680 [Methylobacterium nonmethylotrophicum]
MPRFYFDIHDEEWNRDTTGHEFSNLDDAIAQAKRTLPAMALDHLPQNGDHHTVTVLVTDEDGRPVYTATLSFNGLLLGR